MCVCVDDVHYTLLGSRMQSRQSPKHDVHPARVCLYTVQAVLYDYVSFSHRPVCVTQ